MKYMIMEAELSYAIALSEDGRFFKVPNLGYEVGQTVEHIVRFDDDSIESELSPAAIADFTALDGSRAVSPRRRSVGTLKRSIPLAAAAACLFAFATGAFALWQVPTGTVRVRINPAMSLGVNRFERVVSLKGDNADGCELIEGYGYYGKRVDEVASGLAERAREQGYLKLGGRILIAADSDDRDWREAIESELLTKLEGDLDDDVEVEVETDWDDDDADSDSDRDADSDAEPGSDAGVDVDDEQESDDGRLAGSGALPASTDDDSKQNDDDGDDDGEDTGDAEDEAEK